MWDILIKNGHILDGLGSAPFPGDIAVKDGRISAVGEKLSGEAGRIIDAEGSFVCPGFIDMHSHADITAFLYPGMENYLVQGITTVFTGHCGLSVAPVDRYWLPMLEEFRAACRITGYTDTVTPGFTTPVETSAMAAELKREYGVDVDWRSHGEYTEHLERTGIGANMMCLAGHAQIRHQIMGEDVCRAASDDEIAGMCALLNRELDSGAVGLGIGLDYSPGVYCDKRELVELAKTVAAHGGMVTAHTRAASPGYMGHNKGLKPIDGIRELLEIGLLSGAHVHISHIPHDASLSPEKEEAAALETLALIEDYRSRGVRITWDALYINGWFAWNELAEKLTPYIYEAGGKSAFSLKLGDETYRAGLSEEIKSGRCRSRSPFSRFDPAADPSWAEGLVIVKCRREALIGKTIGEIALERGLDPVDAMLGILAEDIDARAVSRGFTGTSCRNDAANAAFLSAGECCIGFDSAAYDLNSVDSHYDLPAHLASSAVYSGMVSYLLKCCNEPVERSVQRATGNAAKALGLHDRGVLAAGNAADIVIFDREKLDACIDPAEPRCAPKGIAAVIVNGSIAVLEGKPTGELKGRIIRRG